jgi:flagellar protein FlbD
MIAVHRLTHPSEIFFLNPDLIQTIEATPDTVVTLTNASKVIVLEKPYQLVGLIREWRAGILKYSLAARTVEPVALADVMPLLSSRPGGADEKS